jgi:uncharacterized SAM-binding protein YcdF (DUF218 family)
MFIFKKLATPFLLPPGIFIVCLLFSGGWFLFRKKQKIGIFNIVIGCLMWLISITPISSPMLKGLDSNLQFTDNPKGDVIILLGGGIYDNTPDLSGIGVPTQNVQSGIITTFKLHRKLGVPIIVSGGKVFQFNKAEAPIMKRFLMDLGISGDQIILEENSRDTFENAKYTKKICEKLGFKKPILVTSAYHLKRSVISFNKVGLEVTPFPSIFPSWRDKQYHWNDYLPGNFKQFSMAFREYLGILYYKMAH